MRQTLPILDNLKLASPCDMSWEDMRGNDRLRHCQACDKSVYNLIGMAPKELVELIEKTEGSFCGRLYQRADGTLLTEDCPVGLARALRKAKRTTLLATAALVTAMASAATALFGGPAKERPIVKKVIKTIEKVTPPPPPIAVPGGLVWTPPEPPKPE